MTSQMKNDSSEQQRLAEKFPFDTSVGLVATFASYIVSGLFLFGFSYIHEYLISFGISTFEIDVTYYAAAAIGISVLLDNTFQYIGLLLFIGLLPAFTVMSFIVYWARRKFGNRGFWGACALFFTLVCVVAVYQGRQYAIKEAQSVMTGIEGISAYCKLTRSDSISAEFSKKFEELTENHLMRKVIETEDVIYFTYVVEESELDKYNIRGNSLAIKKSNIGHCRFVVGRKPSVGN